MKRRLRLPSPAMTVAVIALVLALGGTSYAAITITGQNVRNSSLTGADIKNSTVTGADVKNRSLTAGDFRSGQLPRGAAGPQGPQGPAGPRGEAAKSRWLLVNDDGEIEQQSGGFSVTAAYVTLPNTAPDGAPSNAQRANGNVYINAGEDLSDNGVVATIALQNAQDQNGDGVTNGRATGGDVNPEFSGEISASRCAVFGLVSCAPPGTNNASHFVVSPRNSDGSVTGPGTRKRFYVVIEG